MILIFYILDSEPWQFLELLLSLGLHLLRNGHPCMKPNFSLHPNKDAKERLVRWISLRYYYVETSVCDFLAFWLWRVCDTLEVKILILFGTVLYRSVCQFWYFVQTKQELCPIYFKGKVCGIIGANFVRAKVVTFLQAKLCVENPPQCHSGLDLAGKYF